MTSTLGGRLVHNHTANSFLYSKDDPLLGKRPSTSMTASMQKTSRLSEEGPTKTAHPERSPRKKHSPTLSPSSSNGNGSTTASTTPNVEMTKVFVLLLEPKTKTFELIQLVYSTLSTTIGDILFMIPQHATELVLGSQKYTGLCRPKEDDQSLSELSLLASMPTTASKSNNNKNCANICTGEILVAIPQDYTVPEVTKFSQAILTNRRFTKLLRRSNPLAPREHSKKKERKSSSRRHKSTSTSSRKKNSLARSRDAVHILEKHDETAEELLNASNHIAANGGVNQEQMMQRALEKAADAAAQANANIPIGSSNSHSNTPRSSPRKSSSPPGKQTRHYEQNHGDGSLGRHLQQHSPSHNNFQHQAASYASEDSSVASSLGTSRGSYASSYASSSWVDGGASVYSTSTAGAESLGESLSSWSKSCGASFSSSGGRSQQARQRNILHYHQQQQGFAGGVARSNSGRGLTMMQPQQTSYRRRKEQMASRRLIMIATGTLFVVAYLTGCYLLDPTGTVTERVETAKNNPMGLPGLFEVGFIVLVLKKIQFLANRRRRKKNGSLQRTPRSISKCPAVRIYAKLIGNEY